MKKTLLPLCLLLAAGSFAQKVTNKISLQKGKTIEVTNSINMTQQTPMGEIPATLTIVELYAVGDAAPGQTQLTKTTKRIQLNASAMGQDIKIDSDNPSDLENPIGQPFKELLKQKQEFTIDAAGLVTAVKADPKAKKSESGMMGMMPGMDMLGATLAVGQASPFYSLPAREIGKGENWTDSVTTKETKARTVFTVKDITDSEILVDFTGEAKNKSTQTQMGMTMDIDANSKNSGTITVDKTTGLVKQKTLTADTESNINMGGGREMNSTTKMTVTTTVKQLQGF